MSKINKAMHEIQYMDQIASRDQWVNNVHPLVKLFLTIIYILFVVSFSKYDVIGLAGMAVYLVILFNIAELSFKECLWRIRIILPIVCIVGIANPFFDKTKIDLGIVIINAGMISMITLIMKGLFAILASYILIATTTIEKICYSLRLLHIPSTIVTQFMLMYRYIPLLLNEVSQITQAYSLRAPRQKGIHFKVWGSLTGQLLLRSIDRANEVYESMTIRGYNGEYHYVKEKASFKMVDIIYLMMWCFIFVLFRIVPIIYVVGNWTGGLIR